MEFQTLYRAKIDFEATYKNLEQLGYHPTLSRGDFGTITFYLKPKVERIIVNIFSKGDYHGIQVCWNNIKEMRKHEKRLLNILIFPYPSSYVKALTSVDFESKLMVINVKIPYNDELLSKIDTAYSEFKREEKKLKAFVKLFR